MNNDVIKSTAVLNAMKEMESFSDDELLAVLVDGLKSTEDIRTRMAAANHLRDISTKAGKQSTQH